MSLLYLTPNDFFVDKGVNSPLLCTKVRGLSIVLFYSPNCPHCITFIPKYKTAPALIFGCTFAVTNISLEDDAIIKMSSVTSSPIERVPYIILYVNGIPFMRYSGPREIAQIQEWIGQVSERVSLMMQQNGGNVQSQDLNNVANKMGTESCPTGQTAAELPSYCIGTPYDGDLCAASCNDTNSCYITFKQAYNG